MRQKSGAHGTAEKHIKDIRRATRKQYSAEEKIRIAMHIWLTIRHEEHLRLSAMRSSKRLSPLRQAAEP